jgi:hypothetical protein
MKTTLSADLANVVNGSVTMFFHSVQLTKRLRPPGGASSGGSKIGEGAMVRSSGAANRSNAASNRHGLTGGFDPPVDLVHLALHCLGDRDLEDELLRLFRTQSRALTAQLSDPSLLSLESKAKIAHKLRGSALAVGARRVASAALRFEVLASRTGDRRRPDIAERVAEARALIALLFAVTEAVAEIDRIQG